MRLIYILVILAIVNAEGEQDKSSGGITNVLVKKRTNKHRSTSSSSNAEDTDKTDDHSLKLKDSSSSSSSSESKWKRTKRPGYVPKSSEERRGWRKWHRKCKRCPEDMKKKWKDITIKWICGVYQRARRSFKSSCMMKYRNCQDGTMFVMLSNGRCKNETGKESYFHGDHFFYEYKVKLSIETTNSRESSSSESSEETSYAHY